MKKQEFDNDKFNKLANRMKSGDLKAGDEIFSYFSPLIYRFFMARVLSRDLAEDLTQDIFVKVVGKIDLFDENAGNFSAWIWQIARNSLIDYYRDKKETSFSDMPEGMENMFRTRDMSFDKIRVMEIMDVVNAFEEGDREIFTLFYLSDLPYREISKITKRSEGSLRVAVHRMNKKIREILK